ncbi:hypothetical protein HPP92_015203 [Vanilla planifolia]|uniref:TATA-binding protein-associated factor BTAF1 n=1 Tax=Vanilla planifolia TaxID=51239 RepID=A0A835QVG0_VANPL|nr:hypothetical protein HPP92_015203 [Vanilla planifolia]
MVDESLKPRLLTLLPSVLGCVRHHHAAVRLAACRCITSMAKSMTISVMGVIIEKAIPMLADSSCVHARQGAGMLVTLLVQGLGVDLVPFAPLLVVPLLRCMSDSDSAVRQSVTHSFAALVPLLPLARGLPPPSGLSESLSRNSEDLQFLEQLLDNSHIDDYQIPVDIKVILRRYQQEGINWLSFLRRFKLHGILCDDMGLGKTLQASAIVASDIVEWRACNCGKENLSLILCPSTLVGHWAYEIEKYIDRSVMMTLQYIGSAQERMLLRGQLDKYNVVITSYDIVRKDIDFLSKLCWNYCILDEGHIIKNSRSKITNAVKHLKAQHRLILSGTPIQNNVLELWSLFDFLMPGFLGTEKQVMPFILRNFKDEVLSDLPEKIIQDRYCDLTPLQLRLYEQFSRSTAKREISSLVTASDTITETVEKTSVKATTHVFQSFMNCTIHPSWSLFKKFWKNVELAMIQQVWMELFLWDITEFLSFAQHRSLLDLIEMDLFHAHMKSVTYLRLDGSVEPDKRFDIVKTFNSDPTIDVLLLTTHVGGLGLNLTSADTLVFMEHDWNPMKDHQAMDRAHQLGQRKVVNVHRLIMRGTLEEKVMSLQQFKLSVANAVINAENASLKTMNTDQLLDLFTPASTSGKPFLPFCAVARTDRGSEAFYQAFQGVVVAFRWKLILTLLHLENWKIRHFYSSNKKKLMDRFNSKLYEKYKNLKKRKFSEIEERIRNLYLMYCAISQEQNRNCQKLLLEESQKSKVLSIEGGTLKEILSQRNNNLDRTCATVEKASETVTKRSNLGLLPVQHEIQYENNATNMMESHKEDMLVPNCCRRTKADFGFESGKSYSPCAFHTLVELLVGMKFSVEHHSEGLCVTVTHQMSGYSFTLSWVRDKRGGTRTGVPSFFAGNNRGHSQAMDEGRYSLLLGHVPCFL